MARRWRRVLAAVVVLGVVGVSLAFGLTPSVGDAPTRVRDLAARDHAEPLLTALPDRLATAVLAVEDHRFYHHHGLDGTALLRAGGATIEVQLAKWLYTDGRSSRRDQAEQAVLAVKLDLAFPKSQVLLMYLNTVYFGHGYYGANAASHGYFGVAPDLVSWPQAALLAGLLQAPDGYDPHHHPEAATQRRNYVLSRLVAVGALSRAEEGAAVHSDLQLSS